MPISRGIPMLTQSHPKRRSVCIFKAVKESWCPSRSTVALLFGSDQACASVTFQGLAFVANLWFGGFPYLVNPGRPEWSKVQTRGKPLVATAQAKYMSAGER